MVMVMMMMMKEDGYISGTLHQGRIVARRACLIISIIIIIILIQVPLKMQVS
jgi:hypothetical protein